MLVHEPAFLAMKRTDWQWDRAYIQRIGRAMSVGDLRRDTEVVSGNVDYFTASMHSSDEISLPFLWMPRGLSVLYLL